MRFSLSQELAQIVVNSKTKEEAAVSLLKHLSQEFYLIHGSPTNKEYKELFANLDVFNTPIYSRVESLLHMRNYDLENNMKVISSSRNENYGEAAKVIESKTLMYQNSRSDKVLVIKTAEGYLEDVWEHLDDEPINYSFTDNIRGALKFSTTRKGGLEPPKYLYNIETGASINHLADAANYLRGILQPVKITELEIYEIDQTKGGE